VISPQGTLNTFGGGSLLMAGLCTLCLVRVDINAF